MFRDNKNKSFLKCFPWMHMLKMSGLLLVYTVVGTIILYCVEECLQRTAREIQYHPPLVNDCINDTVMELQSLFSSINISTPTYNKCVRYLTEHQKETRPREHCTLKMNEFVKWFCFAILSLFGVGRMEGGMHGTWSQLCHIIFTFFGITLTVHLYRWLGIVGVNLLNLAIKRIKELLHVRWKPRQSYQILMAALLIQCLYAMVCAWITYVLLDEGVLGFKLVYTWFMVFLTLSDEQLLHRTFTKNVDHLIIVMFLIPVGFVFTGTMVASVVNIKYRLTLHLRRKVRKKHKGRLQGWLI